MLQLNLENKSIVTPIDCWGSLFFFVINAVISVLDCFAIILMRKRELVAFNLIFDVLLLLVFCGSSSQCDGLQCDGWSAVYDCGISWSYSLFVLWKLFPTS